MIFVTVGTQLPFDRLLGAVEAWALAAGRADVVAQTGPTRLALRAVQGTPFLPPQEIERHYDAAELIVGHAGMGTIIAGLSRGKPVLVMPRLSALREHRNDHQKATAERLGARPGLYVASDEDALRAMLERSAELKGAPLSEAASRAGLIERIRAFINEA